VDDRRAEEQRHECGRERQVRVSLGAQHVLCISAGPEQVSQLVQAYRRDEQRREPAQAARMLLHLREQPPMG
jgi:hypothetical protein